MVGELHKRGFQRLRAAPAMSASGGYWRCHLTPASNTFHQHGGHIANWEALVATYTSGSENQYFGWADRTTATARQLADTFVERFPAVIEASEGRDWLYAGWFVEVLGLAERGFFPYFYADYGPDETNGVQFRRVNEPRANLGPEPSLPLPPPGEGKGVDEGYWFHFE